MGSAELDPNSLWKIKFDELKELATYSNASINLQHIKSNKFLGIHYSGNENYMYIRYNYYKSPLTEHTEGNKYFINFIHQEIIEKTDH